MKTTKFLMMLIGMISFISPYQGGAQNPWNYQRTIKTTDELVEVFQGDGMTILIETYTGAVKGTSIWANLLPVSPSEYERTRFSAKNGQTFWIDMNSIQGLTEISRPYGAITIHPNNLIEVWGAGVMTFDYKANGKDYYVSSHVNYFGVTQWAGADLPSETIRVVEDGSELNGTLSPDGAIYLAESEVIGVPTWEEDGMWWKKKNPNGTNTTLFEGGSTRSLGELLNAALPNSQYGNNFRLLIYYDDGTSNGMAYCVSSQIFTIIDNRSIAVTGISLNKTELTLVRNRSERLEPIIYPDSATNKKVVWESSAPEIASVDQSGLVTAIEAGEATITATTEDGGYTASCRVIVTFNTAVEEVETTKIQIHGQQVTVIGNGDVKIHDLSGRLVRSEKVVGSKTFFLDRGVYLLIFRGKTHKVMII